MRLYFYELFCIFPFLVCLLWSVILGMELRSRRRSVVVLWAFSVVCTLLYFCHSLNFSSFVQEVPLWSECLYIACNLAVYPLFYIYVRSMTDASPRKALLLILVPAVLTGAVSAGASLCGESLFMIRKIASVVFALEVIQAGIFGILSLIRYRRKVANYYADVEERALPALMTLLVLLLVTALFSMSANLIGKDFFNGKTLLAVPSLLFSSLLFCIFHWGWTCRFSAEDLTADSVGGTSGAELEDDDIPQDVLYSSILKTMEEKRLFLKPDLKITDLVSEVGSNRTYVSNCINRNSGSSFSEFVHGYRIRYAISLMEKGETSLSEIAVLSGYLDGNAFYKAFSRIHGKSPSAWMKERAGRAD